MEGLKQLNKKQIKIYKEIIQKYLAVIKVMPINSTEENEEIFVEKKIDQAMILYDKCFVFKIDMQGNCLPIDCGELN